MCFIEISVVLSNYFMPRKVVLHKKMIPFENHKCNLSNLKHPLNLSEGRFCRGRPCPSSKTKARYRVNGMRGVGPSLPAPPSAHGGARKVRLLRRLHRDLQQWPPPTALLPGRSSPALGQALRRPACAAKGSVPREPRLPLFSEWSPAPGLDGGLGTGRTCMWPSAGPGWECRLWYSRH